MSTSPVPVLINRDGGTAAKLGDRLEQEVAAAFAAAGVAIDLRLLPGSEIAAACEKLRGEPLVVVGGGDGTLGSAAGVLAGTDTALGILPVGTRNHLARELGVPLDLTEAAQLIAGRPLRRIDLGEVDGHAFVNNASIGLYPALVEERERLSAPKWLAAVPAALAALRRLRHHRLRLTLADGARDVVTPLLFVGNNHYALDRGQLGTREALDDGCLSVFAVAARRRRALIGFALRAVVGRLDRAEDFALVGDTATLTVAGRSRRVAIALDGEVHHLAMPLTFTLRALALTVVAPADGAETRHA